MNRMFFRILVLGLVACWAAPVPATDGTGYVIERIEVRGNEKTKPEYILRSLPLHTGDRITPDRISASRESLYRTRLFRTVHVASKPGTEQGKAVLVVFVDEKRFGDVGVSFEYTELDGFGYAADAYHVNLWGEGKIVGGEYRQGERLKSFSFSYTDPWLANSGLSAHFKAAASSSDRDLYRSKDPLARGRYDLDRTGGAVGLGQPIGQHYRLVLKYSFEDVQVGDFLAPATPQTQPDFVTEVGAAAGRDPVAFLGIEFYRRPSPHPWGSRPGLDLSAEIDYSASYLGSTANFLRLRTEVHYHLETLPGNIFTLGGRAGAVLGSPPFYERFFLDGPNQLRGFEQRRIGPEGGTEFISLESLYSISMKPVGRLYAFAEWALVGRSVNASYDTQSDRTFGIGILLFNRVDLSFGIGTGTLIVKSHRFGGINVGL